MQNQRRKGQRKALNERRKQAAGANHFLALNCQLAWRWTEVRDIILTDDTDCADNL